MKRYLGEPLPPDARVAVISNDALGNYVVVTPLLQMIRATLPQASIHYFGGQRTAELWQSESLLATGHSIFGPDPRTVAQQLPPEPMDLVVNIESGAWAKAVAAMLSGEETWIVGPSLDDEGRADLPFGHDDRGDLWRDSSWLAPDLAERYPFLDSGFISEIICRSVYLDGPVPSYRLPHDPRTGMVPDMLISMSASLPEKLWHVDSWRTILSRVRDLGWSVGLLGAKPSAQGRYWLGSAVEQAVVGQGLAQDLRGQWTLRQVVGALSQTKRVLTIDNGIMHLAASNGVKTVGLFRHGFDRLWKQPRSNLRAVVATEYGSVAEIEIGAILRVIHEID